MSEQEKYSPSTVKQQIPSGKKGHLGIEAGYAAESAGDRPDKSKVPEQQPDKVDPELLQMQRDFIEANRDVFESISKSNKIKIQPGTAFVIKFGEPIVIELDAKDWQQMREGHFTEEQMVWSTLHEIAHFLDMMGDPVGMRNHFEYMKQKAKQLVPKTRMIWQQALKAKGGDLPSFVSDQWLQGFLYGQIHTLYNCMDDVYVNNVVASKLPQRYLPSAGRGARVPVIKRLYEDYLFKEGNIAGYPKSKQLAYTVLRRHMVDRVDPTTSSPTVASPEVLAVLQKQVILPGRQPDTIQNILALLLKPTTSVDKVKHTPSYRYSLLKSIIEPDFWKLFWEDLKNFPPPKKGEDGKGPGQPGEEGESLDPKEFFKPGQKVKDKKTGKIGTITSIADTGEVTVHYEPESTQSLEGVSDNGFSSDEVTYSDPLNELIIIEEGKPPKGKKSKQKHQGPIVEYTEPPDESEEDGEPEDPWQSIDTPSPIGEKEIDDFLKSKEQYKKEHQPVEVPTEPKLSPLETYKRGKIKYDASLAETYGKLAPEKAQEVAEEWDQYYESVRPYIKELSEVFDQILNTINAQIVQAWETGFKSGRFDINRFIQRYAPALITGTAVGSFNRFINFNELDTYAQREFISRLQILPNNIVFRLVLDNSGSMSGEPILAVKQLMVLLYESLKSFEERTNLRFRLKEPFRVDLQVQTFGSRTTLAKPRGSQGQAERGQMLATLAYLTAGEGGTADAQAWENITAEIAANPDWPRMIKEGKARDLTVEITDGDTQTFNQTQENMRHYMGFVGEDTANGILIANESMTDEQYNESQFSKLFQGNGRPVKHPSELAQLMANLLKKQFIDIQNTLSVEYESSDDFEG